MQLSVWTAPNSTVHISRWEDGNATDCYLHPETVWGARFLIGLAQEVGRRINGKVGALRPFLATLVGWVYEEES